MSDSTESTHFPPELGAEGARLRLGIALSLLELVTVTVESLPSPGTALEQDDRDLFKYLEAARAVRDRVCGPGAEDSVESPAPDSALGAGLCIYGWSWEETKRRFAASLAETRETPS